MIRRRKRRKRRKKARPTVLSEMIVQRCEDTMALVASIRVYKADVAAALGEQYTPALRDGETLPDYQLNLELAGRSVQLAYDRLEEIDDTYWLAKSRHAWQVRELDRLAKKELYPLFIDVRRQTRHHPRSQDRFRDPRCHRQNTAHPIPPQGACRAYSHPYTRLWGSEARLNAPVVKLEVVVGRLLDAFERQ